MHKLSLCGIFAGVLLTGCASTVPKSIATPPPGNPVVAEVRSDLARFLGAQVRWGGTIVAVENKASQTWIELVSRGLTSNGRPLSDSQSGGRFIARFQGFIDPMDYVAGGSLTVAGTVADKVERPIGEFLYAFPVVAVTSSVLWEAESEPLGYAYPPFWYYDPWYPFYPYPWRYSPYWW